MEKVGGGGQWDGGGEVATIWSVGGFMKMLVQSGFHQKAEGQRWPLTDTTDSLKTHWQLKAKA